MQFVNCTLRNVWQCVNTLSNRLSHQAWIMLVHCLRMGNLIVRLNSGQQSREGVDVSPQLPFVLEYCHMLFLCASNKFAGNWVTKTVTFKNNSKKYHPCVNNKLRLSIFSFDHVVLARFKIIFSTSGLNYLQFRVLLTFQATVFCEVFEILWNNIYVTQMRHLFSICQVF